MKYNDNIIIIIIFIVVDTFSVALLEERKTKEWLWYLTVVDGITMAASTDDMLADHEEIVCQIEASVVTGFEHLAAEEVREKLGADCTTIRGLISFSVKVKDVKKVLGLAVLTLALPGFGLGLGSCTSVVVDRGRGCAAWLWSVAVGRGRGAWPWLNLA